MRHGLNISRHVNTGTTVSIEIEGDQGARGILWRWIGGHQEHDPNPQPIPAEAVNFLVNLMLQHMPNEKDPRIKEGSYVIGPDGLKRWVSGPIKE